MKPLRCYFHLHDLDFDFEERPHPLTPMVRERWLHWHCVRCGAEGEDLRAQEDRQAGMLAVTLIVAGSLLLIIVGGILDTV